MMTMQDILMELSEYDVNCKINNGWFLIGVRFDDNWQLLEPTNPLIEFCEHDGMQYYGAPLKDVGFDEVFQCIKDTIEYNKDLERRLALFQEKVKEMQELFKNEDYKALKTLEFKLRKVKDKPVKKNKKEEIEPLDETVVDNEEHEEVPTNDVVLNEQENNMVDSVIVDDGVMFVDTIAVMSDNKMNENNYLRNTD